MNLSEAPVLSAENLHYAYGSKTALQGVNLQVNRGEIVGLLGPNGAGKSTTMRLLAGVLRPQKGHVAVAGLSLNNKRLQAQKKIGYLPENAGVYENITVAEWLTMLAKTYGTQSSVALAVQHVMESCGLSGFGNAVIENLSKGMRQRVFLASSLVHGPELLILDEPTDGLDPNQKRQMHSQLQQLKAHTGILISTHVLEEAQTLCDRILVINQGTIVADEPLHKLLNTYGTLAHAFAMLTAEGNTTPAQPQTAEHQAEDHEGE